MKNILWSFKQIVLLSTMSISDSFRPRDLVAGLFTIYNLLQGDYMKVEFLLILYLLQTNELAVEEE